MAALCAAIAIIAVVVPFAAALSLLGTVPMGLLAYRYRLRRAGRDHRRRLIAFLIGGFGGLMTVINCAYIGGLTGIVKRRGRGLPVVVLVSVVAGAVFGVAAVVALLIASRLRELVFTAMTANVDGSVAIWSYIPELRPAAEKFRELFGVALEHWPILIFCYGCSPSWASAWSVGGRCRGCWPGCSGCPMCTSWRPSSPTDRSCRCPMALRDVVFRYPGTTRDALGPLSMDVHPGEHLAVTGANGSGKTTLMLILAGREPTEGTVSVPAGSGSAPRAAPR